MHSAIFRRDSNFAVVTGRWRRLRSMLIWAPLRKKI